MLKGKTAIVTGGTRGIGLATVKTFLNNGAKVALFGSRMETVDKALEELKPDYADNVIGLAPNLTDYAAVESAITTVKETFGTVDILVNNAGISAIIMKAQGGGSIINISSMVSIYGQPAGCGYPTSKFAVNGLTKSLARELGRDQIRVNAVAPGVTRTDMVAALPKEMVDRLAATIPLGRVGEPEEVANVCLFLASDLASYVTGSLVSVDGATMC